jgi:hypothetical protein
MGQGIFNACGEALVGRLFCGDWTASPHQIIFKVIDLIDLAVTKYLLVSFRQYRHQDVFAFKTQTEPQVGARRSSHPAL